MFGKNKKVKSDKKEKKEKKAKKLKKNKKSLDSVLDDNPASQEINKEATENIPDPLADESVEEQVELTESQKKKLEKLNTVKSKISKILKSSNIEIIDENAGDEYDLEETSESEIKKQQDYDSLKAIFGKDDKNKKHELTLTIDDFDYTYFGRYVDEYDLLHLKNIKKIKLPSKYSKIVKRLVIAAVFIGILIGGIVFAVNLMSEPVYYLRSVTLSQEEQSYFVNENFDYTGIYLYATYTNGKHSYTETIRLKNEFYFASKSRGAFSVDSRNNITFNPGTEAYLYFVYSGLECDKPIKINIKTKSQSSDNPLTVKYTNGIFELKSGDYISSKNLFALVNYENYNSELISLSSIRVSVDNVQLTYSSSSGGFLVTSDISHSSVVRVTYAGKSVELTYKEGAKGVIVVPNENV